jgi:hypothetical protein
MKPTATPCSPGDALPVAGPAADHSMPLQMQRFVHELEKLGFVEM